jgi:hypothetical protein
MTPLLSPQELNEWLKLTKEFARACEDGEEVLATHAAVAVMAHIKLVADPEKMMPVYEQAARYCEYALRDRADRHQGKLTLGRNDEL